VDPDAIVSKYGADTARLFILFAAPPQKELEWNDSAVEGASKFLRRFTSRSENAVLTQTLPEIDHKALDKASQYARKKVYEALKKSNDIYQSGYAFNTLIAAVMEALNALSDQNNAEVWTEGYWVMSNILEPIVPHVCWELSETLFTCKNMGSIAMKEEVFEADSMIIAITVNGKRRTECEVAVDVTKEEMLRLGKEAAAKWIENKTLIKEIYVPNKLVNLVVK
jgi:leucyl-tRNA synthetase